MIGPGDAVSRRDGSQDVFVMVLSNPIHLAAGTGRVVTCPSIPGSIPDSTMALIVSISRPHGVVLPELVQWLPSAALDEPIGIVGLDRLAEARAIVSALIA